jgi:hypothetical protein
MLLCVIAFLPMRPNWQIAIRIGKRTLQRNAVVVLLAMQSPFNETQEDVTSFVSFNGGP